MTKDEPTAEQFVEALSQYADPTYGENLRRYFKSIDDDFIGARMGQVTAVARQHRSLPVSQIDRLLDSRVHEVRMGAVKVMAMQASSKRTPEELKRALFDLYLRRTDAINNWDLVDASCPRVVGAYLAEKPRDILYELARSTNLWERRTAIISTSHFISHGDLDDTFRLAEILLNDREDLIHKAVGWMLRETGKHDRARQLAFLERHAATMPRTTLRYAIEHLSEEQRRYYMGLRAARRQDN